MTLSINRRNVGASVLGVAVATLLAAAPLPAQNQFGSGSDGAMTISMNSELPTPVGRFSGPLSAGLATILVDDSAGFAPGDEAFVHVYWGEGAGTYEFVRVASVSEGPDALNLESPLAMSVPAGSQAWAIRVWHFTELTVNAGATLTSADAGVLAIRATTSVVANGAISMDGKGYLGAPGGEVSLLVGQQGMSYDGAPSSSIAANNGGGGGGGGVQFVAAAGGGGGSHGGPGQAGEGLLDVLGGQQGGMYGADNLATIFMGSGGGSGGALISQSAAGAAGGGVLFIASPLIQVGPAGTIGTSGADGAPGNSTLLIGYGGGGGGAGGATILVAGPEGTIDNAGQILSLGGLGGVDIGTGLLSVGDGGAGGAGRVVAYAKEILNTGTATPPLTTGGGTTVGTGISLSANSVEEGSPNGTSIGFCQVLGDLDPFDFHVFELIDDANGRFGVEGDMIVLLDTSRIDASVDPSHDITVRATDSGGNMLDEIFVIQVTVSVESSGLMVR